MEDFMAHALRAFRAAGLPDAVFRFVDGALRWRLGTRPREQDENRDRAGPLDEATMRDIGACREYQDYAPSARVAASAARRLNCMADSVRCGLPR
jgi:hypothetical protein